MTEATSMVLTGGGLGLGLVAGHRCPEVGAWNQGEPMWIGIVGFWRGIIWSQSCVGDWRRQNNQLPPIRPSSPCARTWWPQKGFLSLVPGSHRFFLFLTILVQLALIWSRRAGLGICCLRFFGYFSQVKVFTESAFMELAVEQFLGKSEEDVKVGFR